MYLKAYLPFLPGFPVPEEDSTCDSAAGTPWYSLGEKECVLLNSESIRLANYGWNELQKFPRVFPKAVEDAEAWRRAVPWILEKLGKAVHGKTSLPRSLWSTDLGFSASDCRRAGELEKSEPKLKPLLDAAGWLSVLEPDHAAVLLKWFEFEHGRIVQVLGNWPGVEGIRLALLFFRFVERDGPDRLAPILETLGTADARTVPTTCEPFRKEWNQILTEIAQRTRTPKSYDRPAKEFNRNSPTKPAAAWADAVAEFAKRIIDQPKKRRRQSLELFAEYIPPNLLARWRDWWDQLQPVVRDAEKLLARVRRGTFEDNEKRSRQARTIQRRFGELFHLSPPSWADPEYSSEKELDLFFRWDDLAWKPYQKSIRSLTRTLSVEHRQNAPRLKTLISLHDRLLANLREDLSGLDIPAILEEIRCWDIPQGDIPAIVDVWWSEAYTGNREELRRIGRTLRYWFVDLRQKNDLFFDVIELAQAVSNEAKIKLFSRVLARSEHRNTYYPRTMLQTAGLLAEDEKEFVRLLDVLKKIGEADTNVSGEDSENLAVLVRLLGPTAWRDDLRKMLLADKIAEILPTAETVAVLEQRKIAVPLPAGDEPVATDWIRRFPAAFAETLRRLAALTPDAESIASRKLESLRFVPEEISEEINTLEHRLADFPDNAANPRIRKRIENLRDRLKNGDDLQPTESRLRRLREKLAERTRKIFFEQWRRSADEILERTLSQELVLPAFPESWREPLCRKIVLGILSLEIKPVKRLGIKLLRSIAGMEAWDYRGEIENVRFLDRLREQGIAPDPWLEPGLPERLVSPNGPPLRLALENDPLEIMKMGAVFGTCLSPWDFNFFSTIANVVDANKRVLYARDPKGAIKARCLLALTDNGELLAFRAYAHEKELGFQEIVADYLERLAKRMNTVVVNTGVVSNLVSPEWYDDGSISVSGLFSFLKDGSEFRKMLPALAPANLPAELEKELAPHSLRSFILPPFLELPELNQRPELVLPLIPYVSSTLSTDNLEAMIKFVDQAGKKREAGRLMKQYMLPRMDWLFAENYWKWKSFTLEWAGRFPDILLPHIRRLGTRGTKKLNEDQASVRRELLVLIYESLGRKRKAISLE